MSTVVSASLKFKAGGGKEKVRKEGHCRMCRRSAAELLDLPDRPDAIRVMTRHHLVSQLWFRQNPTWKHLMNCDANVVPLCRACHDLVELPPRKGGGDYRRELRRLLTQAEITFVIQVRGRDWLEKRYPLVTVEPAPIPIPKRKKRQPRQPEKQYGDVFDLWLEMYGAGGTRRAA